MLELRAAAWELGQADQSVSCVETYANKVYRGQLRHQSILVLRRPYA